MKPARRRGERGVALVEALTAVVLGGLMTMSLFVLFREVQVAQARALGGQGAEMAASYILRILAPAVNAATCAEVLSGGEVLRLSWGRDCGGTLLPGGEDSYVVACVDSNKAVRYAQGNWLDAFTAGRAPNATGQRLLDCDPGYAGWRRLTLPGVEAEGSFSVPAEPGNLVTTDFRIRTAGSPGGPFSVAFQTAWLRAL